MFANGRVHYLHRAKSQARLVTLHFPASRDVASSFFVLLSGSLARYYTRKGAAAT